MSDLFHETLPFEYIAAVFGIMAVASRHRFIVLTKRPAQAWKFCRWLKKEAGNVESPVDTCIHHATLAMGRQGKPWWGDYSLTWPLPNVVFAVSVEDQATANQRLPIALRVPAACHGVSYEPALAAVDFDGDDYDGPGFLRGWHAEVSQEAFHYGDLAGRPEAVQVQNPARVGWLIFGGESGPNARPCHLEWIRSAVVQGQRGGVPVFVKQTGQFPIEVRDALGGVRGTEEALHSLGSRDPHPQEHWFREWTLVHGPDGKSQWIRYWQMRDRKGGDPSEWPEDLRVQQFPKVLL